MRKLFILSLIFIFTSSLFASSLEKISIQLKWKHCFQFAGYYAAVEKGFYKDEGLDVTLKEVDLNRSFEADVLDGLSEYGVDDSTLVIARLKGKPVVLVSQIFQHSPLVFLSHLDSNILTPYDLKGKSVMYSLHGSGATPLKALILNTLGSFKDINISDFTTYQDFIDKKVDVTSAYSTDQPYWLKKLGIEVNIIDPKSYGIDFYGDNLFTSEKELENHPSRVEKVRRATLKGWEYALSHQNEIINIIRKKYAPYRQKDDLEFEARGIYQMIMPELTKLGSWRKEKYEHVAKSYKKLGLVDKTEIDDKFFYHQKNVLSLTKEEQNYIKEHPVIRVGGGPDWAPYDFVKDGKYTGVANDYLNLISKKTGLKFKVIVDKWSNNLQKLKDNKIDLLHAIYYTKDRAKYFLYTKPYFRMLDYFFIRDDLKVNSIKDLDGKRVAIPKGYAHGDILREKFPKIKIVTVDTFLEAVDAVLEKRADALFDTYSSLSYVLRENKITTIIPFKPYHGKDIKKLYMATNKNNPILVSIINKALKSITKEQKDMIYNKWFKTVKPLENELNLTNDEIKWLQNNPKITFRTKTNFLPFEGYDHNGKFIGITADYLKSIEKILHIKFELVSKKDADFFSCDIDSKKYKDNYVHTTSYISTPFVIVMKKNHSFINDLLDIKDKKIALIQEHGDIKDIKLKYPHIKFLSIRTPQEALKMLSIGSIDAVVISLPRASYFISSMGFKDLKIVGKTSVKLYLTFFVKKSKQKLYSIIQKAINSLSTNQKLTILKEWEKVEFAKKTDYMLLFEIAGILGFILLVSLYWNRKLSFEIEMREKIEKELLESEMKLKKLKEKAEKASSAKSEFLANMSHEIRTPMNSILGFSEILEKVITDPIQKDYLSSIKRSGQTLLDLINDILDLSKIEAGKVELLKENVDIREIIFELESMFSINIIQKNLKFDIEIDEKLPKYLLLDSVRLRQILFNLLGNAIKFTQKGWIKLSVKVIDKKDDRLDLEFVVEDSGIGIKEGELEHIFNAFEQQRGQSREYEGTGLGLTISKKLVSIMNGKIDVKSKEGEGSRFSVKLYDIAISSKEKTVNKEKIKKDIIFEPATIMIVDDSKDNRNLIVYQLKEFDFAFLEAKNGKEAIEKLKNIKVDLILLDIKMPIMNGYETILAIKSDENLKDIPVVAITASVMGSDMKKIEEYKFDGYLRKPIGYDSLVSKLAEFLPHKENEQREIILKTNEDNQELLVKFLEVIKDRYVNKYEKIKDKGNFSLIEEFADSLEKVAKEYQNYTIISYAKELKNHCESFDIERVDFMLNQFLEVIQRLEEGV